MKTFKSLTLMILLALAAFLVPTRQARAEVSFSFFYSSLGSHGDWVEVGDYGYCFRPRVTTNWRPYSDGYWSYSDYGWTWVSYEDWGWATYHYGRWVDLDHEGWVWVPGYEWGPAWVSWRNNDDYVGWAPLPPEPRYHGGWSVSFSFGSNVDYDCDIGPGYYNFVSVRDFGSPVMAPVIIDRSENAKIVNKTVNVTKIVNKNKTVYNYGPDYDTVAARSNRPVKKVKVVKEKNVNNNNLTVKQEGDTMVVPAPEVVPVKNEKPAKVDRKIAKTSEDRGWKGIQDPEERKRVREEMRGDNKKDKKGSSNDVAANPETQPADLSTKENGKNRKNGNKAGQPADATTGIANDGTAADATNENRDKQGKNKKEKNGKRETTDGVATQPFEPSSRPADAGQVTDETAVNPSKKNKGMKKQEADPAVAAQEEQRRQEARRQKQAEEDQAAAVRRQQRAQEEQAAEARRQQRQAEAERQAQAEQQAQTERRARRQQEAETYQQQPSRNRDNGNAERQMRQQQQMEQQARQQQKAQQQQAQRQRAPQPSATPVPEDEQGGKKKKHKND